MKNKQKLPMRAAFLLVIALVIAANDGERRRTISIKTDKNSTLRT